MQPRARSAPSAQGVGQLPPCASFCASRRSCEGATGLVVEPTYDSHREVVPASLLLLSTARARCADLLLNGGDQDGVLRLLDVSQRPGTNFSEGVPTFSRCPSFILVQTIEFLTHKTPYTEAVFRHASLCGAKVLVGCHNAVPCLQAFRAITAKFPALRAQAFSWSAKRSGRQMAFSMPPMVLEPTSSRTAASLPEAAPHGPRRFLCVGAVMDSKRDYRLLASLKPAEPIVFVIFGECALWCTMLHRMRVHANVRIVYERGEFRTLVQLLREPSFMVPLITERLQGSSSYTSFSKMSSSLTLALAYAKPLVAWRPLLEGLQLSAQVAHANATAFPAAIDAAIVSSATEVETMRSEMARRARSLLAEGTRRAKLAWKEAGGGGGGGGGGGAGAARGHANRTADPTTKIVRVRLGGL